MVAHRLVRQSQKRPRLRLRLARPRVPARALSRVVWTRVAFEPVLHTSGGNSDRAKFRHSSSTGCPTAIPACRTTAAAAHVLLMSFQDRADTHLPVAGQHTHLRFCGPRVTTSVYKGDKRASSQPHTHPIPNSQLLQSATSLNVLPKTVPCAQPSLVSTERFSCAHSSCVRVSASH